MTGAAIGGQAAVTLTLAGKEYRLRRATVAVIHEAEAEIISRRPDPLARAAEIAAKLPEKQAEIVWKMAFDQAALHKPVTTEELTTWLNSIDGASWFIWFMLQGGPSAPSQDEVRQAISSMDMPELEELAAKVQLALGMGDIKN